jgi:hypothetical protein
LILAAAALAATSVLMASRSKPGYFEGEGPWPSREFPGAP